MTQSTSKKLTLLSGPLLALLIFFGVDLQPGKPAVTATAAVAIWMAIWWISEAVPLAVTALLPIVLFPALGVMSGKTVSNAYINHIIFLFIGGFLVAIAMQNWGLHRRIALRILMLFGRKPSHILLGFMVTTAFLSMWISNTATAMMMVPVVMSIIISLEEQLDEQQSDQLAIGFLLSIAYSASIGGVASLIGTPPNLSFARILAISFEDAPEITFANWMIFALPLSFIMLAASWLLLNFMYIRKAGHISLDKNYFKDQYLKLGSTTPEQKAILVAFISMALLWVFRSDIRLGGFTIPGWSNLFPHPKFFNDGTVAMVVALILFLIPSRESGKRLLNTDAFSKLPWHIILLFGGGFALATGFIESGLSLYLAEKLSGLHGMPVIIIIASLCFMITFLTELTSNTATIEMFLPVIAAMAVALGVNPLLLMIPATLSASFAFMLPVATPPNAIIFGTNRLHVSQMARAGLGLNLLGIVVITLAAYFWLPIAFDLSLTEFPDWAVLSGGE